MSNEFFEELYEFLRYIRMLTLSFLIIFLTTIAVLIVYKQPLYMIYDLAKRGLGTIVIAGTAIAPLVSFIYISLLYSFIIWIPVASFISCRYVEPALTRKEKITLTIYSIAIPVVVWLSLLLSLYVFYPAFIRISIIFSNLVGVQPVYTVDSITLLFVASMILTAVTLIAPLVLDTIIMLDIQLITKPILNSTIKDRVVVYTILYWVYALLTPGDTFFATLLYLAILVVGIEIVIAIRKRKHKKHDTR